MFNFLIIWQIVNVLAILFVFFLIYTWVTRFLKIKQEQNDILRELVNKFDRNNFSDK